MTQELTKYEAAKRAIADCHSVDEVKEIRDKAMAIRIYARQAKDMTMEIQALEIRMRAERRLGQMMQEQPKARGPQRHDAESQREKAKHIGISQSELVKRMQSGEVESTGLSKNPVDSRLSFAESGIDKNLAHKARTFARMSDEEFEERLQGVKSLQKYTEEIIKPAKVDILKIIDLLATAEYFLRSLQNEGPQSRNKVDQLLAKSASISKLIFNLQVEKENVVCLVKAGN